MADRAAPPDLDSVFVWVTLTIERDFIERGVFPDLRREKAADQRGASSLHYLTQEAAQPVLDDARARAAHTRKGLKNAYSAFVRSLQHEVKHAQERRAIFEAPEAVRTYRSGFFERWRGTKAHLAAIGITLEGPWPGEPGGKERRAKALDRKERRTVFVSPYSRIWPGLFEADIEIPDKDRTRAANAEERAQKRAKAEGALQAMPVDADEYRMKLVQNLRVMMSFIKADPVDWHGFTLTETGVESVLLSCDAVVEAIMQAEVHFDEKRHRQIELHYQQQIADADEPFQRMLGELTSVRPEIVEGSAK